MARPMSRSLRESMLLTLPNWISAPGGVLQAQSAWEQTRLGHEVKATTCTTLFAWTGELSVIWGEAAGRG
eukprot:1157151-Pelagomonas_calceolata.AAC.2